MFDRTLATALRRAARSTPVITLLGPRQSGKTTLAKAVFPEHAYVSLERPDTRHDATSDPRAFLARLAGGAVIDEVHHAPGLLSYLQGEVDADARAGRWVLTASQNLLLLERESQTLAGRTTILRLLPLSLRERFGHPSVAPDRWDYDDTTPRRPAKLWDVLHAGLYPRIHDRGVDARTWCASYVQTYVGRDLREVIRVANVDKFERFLRLAAARTGQELNLSELASDAGVTQPTAESWLSALRAGFLVTLLRPWHSNLGKQLRKRPKLHFLDTGLACYLLGIRDAAMLERHPLRGALFESFVVAELTKLFLNAGEEAPLHHWRGAAGLEIDVIVDLGDRVVLVETKSGATVTSDAADGLRRWQSIAGVPPSQAVVVHGGDATGCREGVAYRPWWTL